MDKTNRRDFILKISSVFGSIGVILMAIPVVGVIIEPLLRKNSDTWRTVGKLQDFKVGDTVLVSFLNSDPEPWSGVTARTASWLRRVSDDEFIAFSVNCTHLGCPVQWLPDAQLFLCPCHGGVYKKDGSFSAGPPPKDLPQYPVRIVKDEVQIKASPIPITTL
jgi:menaquinol-cytochrome c reductase iron-sulfur subunit